MRSIVIGLGETGGPLRNILKDKYDVVGLDINKPSIGTLHFGDEIDVMHVCIPYSKYFELNTRHNIEGYKPKITIIHSTVPIGTTSKFPNAVHSPILGKHGNMEESIRKFTKWVGGPLAEEAAKYFESVGLKCRAVPTSEETEMLKLRCLAKYGMSIAFAQYEKELCDTYNVPFSHIWDWDTDYNNNVASHLKRPIIDYPGKSIGGHCVLQNTKILNEQHPNRILEEICKYEPA